MNESSKTRALRGATNDIYFNGLGIDIGAGLDTVHPNAEPFDMQHGDANLITNFRKRLSYDFVYSSHCLEHMVDPWLAINNWGQLLKSNGFMIIIVPHEDLYEQGQWPSLFNDDHKWSFRVGCYCSWSPKSVNIFDLIDLSLFNIHSLEVHSNNLNHALLAKSGDIINRNFFLENLFYKITSMSYIGEKFKNTLGKILRLFGIPIDQTRVNSLAQIQIILQKK